MKTWIIGLLMLAAVPTASWAKTYHVGAARENKSLKPLVTQLKPGDVVEIDSGVYREVMKLTISGTKTSPIVIRGAGTQLPVFDAEGIDTSGRGPIPRGIFQVEGAYIVLEYLELKNARNGENSAGVRLLNSTNAIIRDCKISQCDMGVFGGDRETATIENCDVGFNSTQQRDGYAHNFYMSGNRVVVRNCRIHDSLFGQNFKSRAHYNELWFNYIASSNEGEVGPVDDKDFTERANSNAVLVGNVIVSSSTRTGNTGKFILFGSESGNAHDGTLFLLHNTFIAGDPKVRFITLADARARAVIRDNVFVGSAQFLNTTQTPLSITASGNWTTGTASLPDGWANPSTEPLTYTDGDGVMHTLSLDENGVPRLISKPRLAPRASSTG